MQLKYTKLLLKNYRLVKLVALRAVLDPDFKFKSFNKRIKKCVDDSRLVIIEGDEPCRSKTVRSC